MISIEVKNINLSLHENKVLENINFEIDQGDYVGIIGPNGSGKSTLIKVMLGLIKPDSGTVKFFGKSLENFEHLHDVGYVPQRIAQTDLHFPATVEEVVRMGTYGRRGLFNLTTKEDNRQVKKSLEQVEMQEYKNRQISDLSGGQLQRVLIARALVSKPEVLFLDEPTVGVDIKTQKQFYALLRKLNRELCLTLVLASHELQVIAHEATELVYINRTLEYYGEPKQFLNSNYFQKV